MGRGDSVSCYRTTVDDLVGAKMGLPPKIDRCAAIIIFFSCSLAVAKNDGLRNKAVGYLRVGVKNHGATKWGREPVIFQFPAGSPFPRFGGLELRVAW